MYAIIEDSGSQIRVQDGDLIDVDLRDLGDGDAAGKSITFDRVLMVGEGDGATLGRPYVDGAAVTGEILGEKKARKIDVIKFKRRKGYRVKQGHRQRFLRVKITGIKA